MIFRINHYYHPDHETKDLLLTINRRLEAMTTALENLAAAEATLETVMAAVLADIDALTAELAAANTANDPAIQAVADKLTALTATAQAKLPAAPTGTA